MDYKSGACLNDINSITCRQICNCIRLTSPDASVLIGKKDCTWELKVSPDFTGSVKSVNGQTGDVVLTTTNINEGTNLYYTSTRARNAISGGSGIGYDNTTGIITNTGVLSFNTRTGAVTPQSGDYTTTLVSEGTNLYYTDARSRLAISTSGAALSYNNVTGVITSIALVPSNVSGTAGRVPRFTATNTIGNGIIQDDGTKVAVNTTPQIGYEFYVNGQIGTNNNVIASGNATFSGGTLTLGSSSTDGLVISGGPGSTDKWIQSYGNDPFIIQPQGNPVLINTTTNAGYVLDVNGTTRTGILTITGLIAATTTVTGTYVATTANHTIRADCSTANVTVTLPASTTTGKLFYIKKIGSSNTLTINTGGTTFIDGSLSLSITQNYQTILVQFNGTGYDIL